MPESLDALMRSGPLPRSVWVHKVTREMVSVVTTALSAGGWSVQVVFARTDGVTWVCGLDEFTVKYEPAKGVMG